MAWSVEITHIDVVGAGDATLIVANDPAAPAGSQFRTALIDGGELTQGSNSVHAVLQASGAPTLDVMVTTHYDGDHVGGMRRLLNWGHIFYAGTRIFDQGEPEDVSIKRSGGTASRAPVVQVSRNKGDNDYELYRIAIGPIPPIPGGGVARSRPTQFMQTRAPVPATIAPLGWLGADWVVGQELLWAGAPPPLGAPTLTCIAANTHVLQAAGGTVPVPSSVVHQDLKNPKSLALLLQFGNFKYYVGGDIEAVQEDGSDWSGGGYTPPTAVARGRTLSRVLNPTANLAGRVHAFKTSHHGSKYSSSPWFINHLRPQVAFISCGTNNPYAHPDAEVMNALQTAGVPYFLTGTRPGLPLTPLGVVAGTAALSADVTLRISAAQSVAVPVAFTVHYDDAGGAQTVPF